MRAAVPTLCGNCHRQIAVGEPLLLLLVTPTITKRRCGPCAGGAPPDLPRELQTSAPPPLDMTRLGLLPLDWSRGEREPGEEG